MVLSYKSDKRAVGTGGGGKVDETIRDNKVMFGEDERTQER